MQRKRFEGAVDVRRFPHGRVDVVELDDVVVGRMTYEPGWRWSNDIQPIAGTEWCTYHHLGVSLSGRLRVETPDGIELEIGPGDVFEIPPGHDAWVIGDEPWVSVDFEAMRSFGRRGVDDGESRTLATILFTDIVDSTATAERVGDTAWQDLIARHNDQAQGAVDRHRGRVVKWTGDGMLALFDSAERAARAALLMRAKMDGVGLELRQAVHTGEVEVSAGDVRGIAVHAAARVLAVAQPGEILVSATVRDLLDGAPFTFTDRGQHELKGLSGHRQVFAMTSAG